MEPRFRKRDGILNLTDTLEATKVKKSNKDMPWIEPLSPEEVMDKARTARTARTALRTNWLQCEGRAPPANIPLCQRLYFTGVISPAPEPVHPR